MHSLTGLPFGLRSAPFRPISDLLQNRKKSLL